jgi:phosphatidylglycerophosphatase A
MAYKWSTVVATFFFVGLIPLAPGTFGSLASFPLYYLILGQADSFMQMSQYLLIMAALLTLIGVVAISKYQETTYNPDHPSVVIDEVVGMLVTIALAFKPAYEIGGMLITKGFFANYNQVYYAFLISFVIFRYFDISKPLIIGYVDRKMKNPFGVILDDILAGICAAITIIAAHKIILKYFM